MPDQNPEEVNLDEQPVPQPPPTPAAALTLPGGLTAEPFKAIEMRENVRGVIAKWLVLILAALVTVPFWFIAWRGDQAEAVVQILQIVLGPVVALVGSATGFYFGLERSAATSGAVQPTPPGQGKG